MSTANFVLDSTYSSFDNDHIEEWRAQVRSNEEWMREHLPVHGFSEKAVGHFVEVCCYSKRAAVAEFKVMGCTTYGSVRQDPNGSIDVSMFMVTPDAFYAGQGVTIYQSHRDSRFEQLRQETYAKLTADSAESKAVLEWSRDQEAKLLETIWQERVDLLFGMV